MYHDPSRKTRSRREDKQLLIGIAFLSIIALSITLFLLTGALN